MVRFLTGKFWALERAISKPPGFKTKAALVFICVKVRSAGCQFLQLMQAQFGYQDT